MRPMSTMREVRDNSTMQEISLTRPENLKWSYELLDNFLTCDTCYKQYKVVQRNFYHGSRTRDVCKENF